MSWIDGYIGKPWVSGSSGPEAYDCHGIVRAAYRDRLGIALPVVEVDAGSALDVARAVRAYDYSRWAQVPRPENDFDVVEMSFGKRPHHVGVWLNADGGGVLTSVEGAGVIFQSLSSLRAHGWNIVACYRLRSGV